MKNTSKEQWAVVFQAEGPGQPLPMRVKLLLKAALRRYGLRCCDYWIVADDAPRKTRPESTPAARSASGMTDDPSNRPKRASGDVWGRNGDIDPEGVEL